MSPAMNRSVMVAGAKCIQEEREFSTPSVRFLWKARWTNAYTLWTDKR